MQLHIYCLDSAKNLKSYVRKTLGRRSFAYEDCGIVQHLAVFPGLEWQCATDDEEFLRFDADRVGDTIILGRLAQLPSRPCEDSQQSGKVTYDLHTIVSQAINMLRSSGYSCYPQGRDPVLQVTEAGSDSTTFRDGRTIKLGLHFDNIDMLPVEEKPSAPVRLSINVGEEPRHLAVSPVSYYEAVEINSELLRRIRRPLKPSEMASAALLTVSSIPIFELTIPQGGFYVAPTQNLIHDGNTLDRTTADYAITCWLKVASPIFAPQRLGS